VELPVEIVSADAVRELIARADIIHESGQGSTTRPIQSVPERLADIRLHPHQVAAVGWIRAAMEEFGGAFLADEVGMGKTFVALAVARRFHRCLVVAPAVLRDMWSQQSRRTGQRLTFVSFESLSRGRRPAGRFDLVVIDEAHHVRNPRTRRYHLLSRIATRATVLMLSATPIHNRRNDLTALLSLFLGARAKSLSASEIARCVVRRHIETAGLSSAIPEVTGLLWKDLEDDDRVPEALLSLPPPIPAREGGDGGVLVVRSLLRQWCSSDAALESALRRRLARSIALMSALECGHYPSGEELSAWTIVDDSVQLAFPSLVATPHADVTQLLEAIRLHHTALQQVLRSLDGEHPRDLERAHLLKEVRLEHPGIPIVAFSHYAETVTALFRKLRRERGIAVLTAKGARVAGGPITRCEAISRFAPRASGVAPCREVERIDLLLATDLLSEGVNLQDAGVVVHLDLPWTPARLEQRLGRVARLGSSHGRVYAYGIRPPASAEILIRIEATIRAKMREASASIGPFRPLLPEESVDEQEARTSSSALKRHDPVTATERIRAILEIWRDHLATMTERPLSLASETTRASAVSSRRSGFLALCIVGPKPVLLGSDGVRVSDEPTEILELLLHASGGGLRPRAEAVARSLSLLQAHFRTQLTVNLAEPQAAGVAQARKAALRRVSGIVQNARPHARARSLELAESARKVILGRLGIAAESELIHLGSADLQDEEWLRAIMRFKAEHDTWQQTAAPGAGPDHPRVSAILLLDSSAENEITAMKAGGVTSAIGSLMR
jgi:superfamily II DNA or RNA helicase